MAAKPSDSKDLASFKASLPSGESVARPALLRRMNEQKVIDILRSEGAMSRAGLVRKTGLSHPTVTKIVDGLCEAAILEEGELKQPDLGRPARVVALASLKSQVIGMVIGVHRCSLIATGLDGVVRQGSHVEFETLGSYAELLSTLDKSVEEFLAAGTAKTLGLGICVPGLLDPEGRTVMACPNLSWMEGKPLAMDLEKRLKMPVTLVKAMSAHHLFEASYGAAQGIDDFVVVNYAGGLGVSACSGGRMVDGGGGLAGELGHITVDIDGELCGCGNRGCLETIASDRAVLNAASERVGKVLTLPEVIERAQSGSREFDDILERSGRYLAIGLAAAINIFNPRAIFVYGKFLKVWQAEQLPGNNSSPGEGYREGVTPTPLFERVVEWTSERALQLSSEQCEIFQPERDPHECQQIGAAAAIIKMLTAAASAEREAQKGEAV